MTLMTMRAFYLWFSDNFIFMVFKCRWLSKGKSLERIWSLRNSLLEFLRMQPTSSAVQEYITLLTDLQKLFDVAFLVDMLGKLNDLNLKLQVKFRKLEECGFPSWLRIDY